MSPGASHPLGCSQSSCLPILEILDGKGPEGQDPTKGEATCRLSSLRTSP